jgi:hypothetical protein
LTNDLLSKLYYFSPAVDLQRSPEERGGQVQREPAHHAAISSLHAHQKTGWRKFASKVNFLPAVNGDTVPSSIFGNRSF